MDWSGGQGGFFYALGAVSFTYQLQLDEICQLVADGFRAVSHEREEFLCTELTLFNFFHEKIDSYARVQMR